MLLPFEVGRYQLVDVAHHTELQAAAHKRWRELAHGAVFGRHDGSRVLLKCTPAEALPPITFAVMLGDEMRGVWSIYQNTVVSTNDVTWTIEGTPAPMMPGMWSGHESTVTLGWAGETRDFLAHFLRSRLATDRGFALKLERWVFPSVARGEPEHYQWNVRDNAPLVALLAAETDLNLKIDGGVLTSLSLA